jgi:hypothetical protein
MRGCHWKLILPLIAVACAPAHGEEPLRDRIDRLIASKAGEFKQAPLASDPEFVRRVYLDLVGSIPSRQQTEAFLNDTSPDKRITLVDALLASPAHAQRMAEVLHLILMERRGDDKEWQRFLRSSVAQNKPWDELARDILAANTKDPDLRGAAYFFAKRLETYGQNLTDFPGLTRDIGRLFLGQDLQCAQCHDHLLIDDYKQRDFQGLFVVYSKASIESKGGFSAVKIKSPQSKLEFISVFDPQKRATGPRIPGGEELELPAGEQDGVDLLTAMAAEITRPDNTLFARNAANRLWAIMMGRGLVHPLDLHHSDNPPSHPELLDLLAEELVSHRFDMKWMMRDLALTKTYQRSSRGQTDAPKAPPDALFHAALEKPLTAEQFFASAIQATGAAEAAGALSTEGDAAKELQELKTRFLQSFAAEPGEADEEGRSTVKGALFLLNDAQFLKLLEQQPGNLVHRLVEQFESPSFADELFLSVLSRPPEDEERREVAEHLKQNDGSREVAVQQLVWALLASAEFAVNH